MISYDALYSHMNPGIHVKGLEIIYESIFGHEFQVTDDTNILPHELELCGKMCFQLQPSEDAMDSYVPFSHPSYIFQLFTKHALNPAPINIKYTESGLAKLLLFSSFLRTKSQSKMDVIAKELKKYPYTMKEKLQVREK